MSSETVELELQLLGESAAAYLVRDGDEDGDPECWLPKSQVEVIKGAEEPGQVGTFEVPEWLAVEKGLV